ncbi:zinc-dependent peptidase [uncultured Tateyamaria sp.]|uniref:M90 family metallopeptidase n=1 Tax=uncultured Tateyamaria sp. TaxID=455651 RepID=UPI00263331CD|nr:M90 family metallopeptidase [uncultured Tateyamaria sp.]
MIYFFGLLTLIGLALAYRTWRKRQWQQEVLASRLTDEEWRIIRAQMPLIRKLPPDLKAPFEGKVALLLNQADLVGCNGLEVTDEMALSIAAQAALLVVNTDAWYKHLTTVLIYPGAFKSKQTTQDGYVVTEQDVVRLGESWSRGPVVLSWQDAQQGGLNDNDGLNVVLHEFAHQLDDLSGQTDGAPPMAAGQSFATWRAVIVEAFDRHVASINAGRRTVIDPYGATNHEEFFAVAVEAFFERPQALKRAEPDVYDQIAILLNVDPASWS